MRPPLLLMLVALGACREPSGSDKDDDDTGPDSGDTDTDGEREVGPNAGCTATIDESDNLGDKQTVRVWDAWGDLTEERVDEDANGTFDHERLITYDAAGHRTQIEWFRPVGELDTRWTYTWSGNQLTEELEDEGGDGEWETRWTHGYTGGNNVWSFKESSIWSVDDVRITRTFDGAGHVLTVVEDVEDDGTAERRETYTYSGDLLITEAFDYDGDGDDERINTYTYDGDRLVRIDADVDGDGTNDLLITQSWDGDLLVQQQTDENKDGEPEETISWFYDSADQVIREYHDYPRAETPEWELLWTWDAAGREVKQTRGWDGEVWYQRDTTWVGCD